MSADMVLHGGRIHTLNAQGATVEAVAWQDGRILAAGAFGDVAPLIGPGTRQVDLGGVTVVPGLNDAHVHVWKVGQLRTTSLDLRGLTSLDELYRQVSERARMLEPGQWLVGRGWNEALMAGGEGPTKAGLDVAAPRNPVLLTRTCAHIHALNSRAMGLAGIDEATPAPPGGEIDTARGHLIETAFGLVTRAMPAPTQLDQERWILAGLEHLASLGITSATDPAVDPRLYAAYRALDARGALPIRVNLLHMRRPDGEAHTYDLPERYDSDFLRCDSVKFFADGGLSGATAALDVPYRGTSEPTQGVLRFEAEELYELTREAHLAGLRIGTHAIGPRALDQVLGVYERLYAEHPSPIRHRVEHFGLPAERHLRQAKDLNIHVVPQAIFLHELRANFLRYLPEGYDARCYNLRAMFDAGLNVALSSDGPVVRELNPLVGLHAATAEPMLPGNEITPAEALRAYTLGGALAQGDEPNRGSLEPGKWADLTLLSADPLTDPEPQHIQVLGTYVGGKLTTGTPSAVFADS